MLKGFLYVCVSLLTLACYSQASVPGGPGPAEIVVEDPNHTIADLNGMLNTDAKAVITWRVNGTLPEFFAIERSEDGKNYEVVAVLNDLSLQSQYRWIDDAPKRGRSFYRIRYSFREGQALYSKELSFVMAGYISFKFYPNPVDQILIVRSDSPVDVQISDVNGKTRITEPRVMGLHTLNVSSLEKGIYLIRFSNKLTNVMSQEKLIKN